MIRAKRNTFTETLIEHKSHPRFHYYAFWSISSYDVCRYAPLLLVLLSPTFLFHRLLTCWLAVQVVELKLRNLDQVQQAFDIVRAKPSAQGAQHVADYCSEVGNFRGAIEFLLLANKSEDAFKLAQAQVS